jgi:hypothetical protein
MIKLIACGLWVCLVTLLSAYAAVSWQAARKAEPEAHKLYGGLETVRTRMISVPVVADGAIHGYVMAQFIFTVDSKVMKRLTVKPDVFIVDEVFRAIFGAENVDFRHFRKQDLPALSKQIADNLNKRLGEPLIDDVMVQELNYISKDSVRGGIKSRGG